MAELVNREKLANVLKEKFKELGLASLREAAKLLGISPSTLSRLLNCKTDPDTKTLAMLRNSPLAISIDSLLQDSSQLSFADYIALFQRKIVEVHFRCKRKKMEAYPDEVKETLEKIIRLAHQHFSNKQA